MTQVRVTLYDPEGVEVEWAEADLLPNGQSEDPPFLLSPTVAENLRGLTGDFVVRCAEDGMDGCSLRVRVFDDFGAGMIQAPKMSVLGADVTITRSAGADDAVVVFVDTDAAIIEDGPVGPRMRILLNDEPVFEGEPYVSQEEA